MSVEEQQQPADPENSDSDFSQKSIEINKQDE